jgi:hypothetical protein
MTRRGTSTLRGEAFEDGLERNPADAVLRAIPSKSIQPSLKPHPDAGQWMLHSLRAEQRLPRVARHRFHPHRVANRLGKARGDVVRRIAARPFEFDNALARPAFEEQADCRTSNIGRGDHRNRMIERL